MGSGVYVGYFVSFILGISIAFVVGKHIKCTEALEGETFPVEDDCDAYYLCSQRTLVLITCPEGFSFKETACVPSALEDIECGTKRRAKGEKKEQIQKQKPRCRRFETGLKVHPRKCSLYLDCDANDFSRFREHNTRECEYPMLFDEVTLRCRNGSDVDCGTRTRPRTKCEYESNECLHGNCEPCELRLSTCAGRPDGRNALSDGEQNPLYLVCSKGSLIERKQCPYKDVGRRAHRTQTFNPESGQCELPVAEQDTSNDGPLWHSEQHSDGGMRLFERPRDDAVRHDSSSEHVNEKPWDNSNSHHGGHSSETEFPREGPIPLEKQRFGDRRQILTSRGHHDPF